MPFTFSHPAIVLPITYLPKRWYSLTGLVVGSVAPDFEYFFRMNIQSIYSHTIPGIFYFNLPVALLLSFVFHAWVRNPLISNTPRYLSKHLATFKPFNWVAHFKQNWLVVLVSMIAGAGSHILWDGFTHGNGFWVDVFPFLKQTVIQTATLRVPLYTIMQHTSSLVGLFFIYMYIKKLPATYEPDQTINVKYWLYLVAFAVCIIVLRYVILGPGRYLGDGIITIVSSFLAATIITSIILKDSKRQLI